MTEKKLSKFLSMLLRHKPETLNLKIDDNGWTDVNILITKINAQGHNINQSDIDQVVINSDKKRFSFNSDKTKIKANQGHSIKVKLYFKTKIPPTILYHGTQASNKIIIRKKGINKMKRHHVHLSSDLDTAIKVAKRRGPDIVIFTIDTKTMVKDNIKFYISDNEVWLTDFIDPKYIA